MTKNGGRIWAHDWENSGGPAGRKKLADRCSLTMSLSGASASAAAKQRHQEQRRADTSALADAARGQRQMPELPPYVPEFDLAFMSQMLGVGAVRSEPEDPATGDDETIMQEAAVDVALQLLTDGEGLQALLASDEPSADRVALEGADNALANSRARVDQLYEVVNRQIRVFLVLRYISPLTTSRSTVRPWMVRWSSASSIEPSNSGHRV